MTPDSPKSPREELEARLTALLLGELSAEEAAALRQAIAQDPELAKLENQLKETIGLVREAAASKEEKTVEPAAPLQLSAERREKLLASFKTSPLELAAKPRRKFRLNRELLKLAAMIVALLLVGGVVVSHFAPKAKSRAQRGDRGFLVALFDSDDSAEANVKVINGSESEWTSYNPIQTLGVNKPAESTTPRSGKNAGGTMVDAYAADAAWEGSKDQVRIEVATKRIEPAPITAARTLPPPPASRPEPANKQLAQNLERSRFRSTIALPTAADSQAPGATARDSFGDFSAGRYSAGVPEQLGEESIVRGRTELAGELGGNRGNSWFGGFGAGGGGLGGGAGPVAPAEGKEASRPDAGMPTADGLAFGNQASGNKPSPGNWGSLGFPAKDFNGRTPAITANPAPAIDPATGLPVASTAGGKDASGLGLWDTTMDDGRTPALPALVPAQPVTTPPSQTPPQGGYQFRLASDDIGGLRIPHSQGQVGAASGVPGTVTSESGTANAPRLFGAYVEQEKTKNTTGAAGVSHIDAGFRGTDGGVPLVVTKSGELPRTIPTAPTRPIRVAPTPVETPAPAQKPDAAKTATFSDDMDALLVQTPNTTAVPYATPSKTPPPPTAMPPAKAAPAPTVLEKNAAGQTLADGVVSDRTIELYNVTITNSAQFFADYDSPVGDLANRTGQRRSGGVVADPTQSTAEGMDWGLQQKADTDGDSVSRLARLKDLKQLDSKSRASRESDRAWQNPRQPHFGNATEDDSRWNVGAVLDSKSREKVLRDKERLPQTAAAEPERLEDLTQRESKEKALAEVQDKLGKAERSETATNVYSVNAVGYVNQDVSFGTTVSIAPPVVDEERKKHAEVHGLYTSIAVQRTNGSAGDITVNRIGGATGPVTVQYEKYETNRTFVGGEFTGVNAPPRASEESVFRKSRTEIALPPGGANVQGVEREPRMQAGPVVINEINYNPPTEERNRYAQRLNQPADRRTNRIQISEVHFSEQEQLRAWQEKVDQALPRSSVVPPLSRRFTNAGSFAQRLNQAGSPQTANRAASGTDNKIQVSGVIGPSPGRPGLTSGAGLSGVPVESLNQTDNAQIANRAELERLTKLNQSLQSASREDLRKMLTTASPDPDLAAVLKGLSVEGDERNRYDLNRKLDERLEGLRSDVKARVEQLQAEVAKETTPVQEYIDVVIPLKTAPAADIVRMLNSRAATGELHVAGQTKIIVDERTNSLLIFASRNDLNSISNAIRRLDAPVPQGEVETAENAFSTFSLNVSDVSFKLAAASLEKGQMPDPASVRSEEFINAFDYRDPEPKGSAPIAFAWERTRYPFAHNRDLLRLSVKTAASGRQPGRPLNLVLLLDNSGSMERADRVRVVDECIRVLTGQLRPEDRVSVIAFARTARLVVDGLSGTNIVTLPQQIGELAPDGGTNLEDAMNVAYQAALKHFLPNGVNRVVLLTDGAANLGDVEPESLKKKVEAHRKQGVALDCFGIGWDGYNDDLLEVLSRNGDGRYGFVNTPEAAASEFAGQLAGALRVAASDVKVQVEFNPRRVTTYRQIGYAKHQLKKEQFRDNTVDAAEIGAAEQGNALYTVQVNPNGEGPIGVVRVRFKVPGTSDYREHEWALPYSGAATPLEQSSPALRLAATASAFSEWLVSSPFAAEVTPDRLLGYLSGVPETCAADPRPKKLEWMIRQARSLAGK